MRSVLVLTALALSLLACKTPNSTTPEAPADEAESVRFEPEVEGAPVARVDTTRNSGAALVSFADAIIKIELSDGERVIGELHDQVRDQVRTSLRREDPEAMCGGLSATSPPWPGHWVWIHVEGRGEPFVASIVSGGALRLNARDPYSLSLADDEGAPDFDNICDVGYSELLFDAVSEALGPPTAKEYQRAPKPKPKCEPAPRDDEHSKKKQAPARDCAPAGDEELTNPFADAPH